MSSRDFKVEIEKLREQHEKENYDKTQILSLINDLFLENIKLKQALNTLYANEISHLKDED